MFDIGFSELLVIGVVALLVIGPERLPKVARTAGALFGRFQRYVAGVKSDIQREMEASDLANLKTEVQDAARSFEQSVNEQVKVAEAGARALEQSLDSPTDTNGSAATMSATSGAALDAGAPADPAAPASPPSEYSPPTIQQKLVQ